MATIESWGRYPRAEHHTVPVHWRSGNPLHGVERWPVLAFGQGRSYGDACLNDGGTLLLTSHLDRFIDLDPHLGTLRCEAGVTLGDILDLVVPHGYFLPVVPGTKHVSVGGAIANDVHGKNHHRDGTFGRHVLELELLRSSGERLVCSPERNPDLFAATVAGLGLTGLILSAHVRLRPITSPLIDAETVAVRDLDHFFEVCADSDRRFEYTVSWVDCLARGSRVGRGLFFRGNHASGSGTAAAPSGRKRGLSVPFDLPGWTLNRFSVGAFNALYHLRNRIGSRHRTVHYDPFFFPLDSVGRWNRIYGSQGLLQFQCVIPTAEAARGMRELLEEISRAGTGSFLAVLKTFGALRSPGMLSFPRSGATLALDFPNRGAATFELFERLARKVRDHGGAMYPAKDSRMSPEDMAASYPRLPEFKRHVDPGFSSSLWRRVTGAGAP